MQRNSIFESNYSIVYIISLRVYIFLDHPRVTLHSDLHEWHTTSNEPFFLYGDLYLPYLLTYRLLTLKYELN